MGPSEPSPYASRFLHSLVTSSRSARSPRSCLRRVWSEEGTSVRGENVTREERSGTRNHPTSYPSGRKAMNEGSNRVKKLRAGSNRGWVTT